MNKNALFIGALLVTSATTFHWIMRDVPPSVIVGTNPSKKESQKTNISSETRLKKELHQTNGTTLSQQTKENEPHVLPQELT